MCLLIAAQRTALPVTVNIVTVNTVTVTDEAVTLKGSRQCLLDYFSFDMFEE